MTVEGNTDRIASTASLRQVCTIPSMIIIIIDLEGMEEDIEGIIESNPDQDMSNMLFEDHRRQLLMSWRDKLTAKGSDSSSST